MSAVVKLSRVSLALGHPSVSWRKQFDGTMASMYAWECGCSALGGFDDYVVADCCERHAPHVGRWSVHPRTPGPELGQGE